MTFKFANKDELPITEGTNHEVKTASQNNWHAN